MVGEVVGYGRWVRWWVVGGGLWVVGEVVDYGWRGG